MRARPLLHGMRFTISAARRLGVGQSSDSAEAESLQSDAACLPSSDDFCVLLSANTVLVIRRRRALMRATRAAMRSSPLGMPGEATERAEEAVVGLGVLLRTTDCSAAANAGDDMSGGELIGADEAGDSRREGGGGGGGGGGAVLGENGLTEHEIAEDGDRTEPMWSAFCKSETAVAAPACSANALAHAAARGQLAAASAATAWANPVSINNASSTSSIHLKLQMPSNTARPAALCHKAKHAGVARAAHVA